MPPAPCSAVMATTTIIDGGGSGLILSDLFFDTQRPGSRRPTNSAMGRGEMGVSVGNKSIDVLGGAGGLVDGKKSMVQEVLEDGESNAHTHTWIVR